MRVGFTGSQGTGKTTLAEAMVADPYFKKFHFVPSASRDAQAAGFNINKDAGRLDQMVITVARMAKENKAFDQHEDIVSDRMLLDSLAYTTYQMECTWIKNRTDNYYLELTRDLVMMSYAQYDKVFFFPPYFVPEADGVRLVDPVWQLVISDTIEDFLYANSLKFEVVPDMPVEDRVDWMRSQIHTKSYGIL